MQIYLDAFLGAARALANSSNPTVAWTSAICAFVGALALSLMVARLLAYLLQPIFAGLFSAVRRSPTGAHTTEWQSNSSLQRLPLIIDLFYGFAIANGLSDALKSTVTQHSLFQYIYLAMALLLGIGDWLGYHVHVSHLVYRSLTRLLMDMLFPALIYCLLLAPTLHTGAEGIGYAVWFIIGYFGFALIYCRILAAEEDTTDPNLVRLVVLCLLLSVGSLAALEFGGEREALPADVLALASVSIWAVYNIRAVYRTMKFANPTVAQG